jgi:glycosyltransferase involved in cell wall biosynthesis
LKVLLVCNGFPPSGQWGTEYYTHQLAMGLLRAGDEVLVLHPVREAERPRFSVGENLRYGVRVIEVANNGDPRKRFADSYRCAGVEAVFEALLERERPDVVHFMHLLWGLSVRLPILARARGVRTVVTPTDFGLVCHRGQLRDWRHQACAGPTDPARCARCVREPGAWDRPPLQREAKRLAVKGLAGLGGLGRVVVASDIEARQACIAEAARSVDHWILPTRALGDSLRQFGIGRESSTLLPYGLDERKYAGPRPAAPAPGVRFVYMSQYMPHKGLACLLEAARSLAARLPESVEPWSVALHGNGTRDRDRLYARQVLALPLPRRVTDCGPFEPLRAPEVLARTDCVVVPSEWHENAPLTVLQARAAGVPVIASDVPGVREILEPGRHGLLFPVGDARALADAMGAVVGGRLPVYEPDPLVPWDEHLREVRAIQCGAAGQELQPRPARALARQGA